MWRMDSPVHPALMCRAVPHTHMVPGLGAHTHELTFCQGVRCIEIPPPFHLIWKKEGSRVEREQQIGKWRVAGKRKGV